MFWKSFGLFGPLAVGGLYFSGAFGAAYEREVDRAPAVVMASLGDLDITKEPGSPGTDPSRSGGVTPMFVLERGTDTMTWKVMSGQQVATSMTARFEPIGDGSRTRVTAKVARGDAPDDFVSPAFRSPGLTMGLFAMALETELNELTLPPGGSEEKCREMMEDFQNAGAQDDRNPDGDDRRGFGEGVNAIMAVSAMEMKLRRAGCDTSGGGDFRPVSNEMGASAMRGNDDGATGGPSFAPGKPMIDLGKRD